MDTKLVDMFFIVFINPRNGNIETWLQRQFDTKKEALEFAFKNFGHSFHYLERRWVKPII